MRVRELIELLEELDQDMEVQIAYQPNYPICAAADDVRDADGKVYICQLSSRNDYAPAGIYDK